MTIQKLAYTFEEAAEQSGYSARTLKQAVADGNLTARYVKTEGVIRHEDLAAWIGQLPTKPNTDMSAGKGAVLKAADANASPDPVQHIKVGGRNLPPTPVQGMDGKTYTRPDPQPKAHPPSLPVPESEWWTPEDLATMWQISVGTISNWRTLKKGPEFVRIGGLVRYSPEAVKAWVQKQSTD